MTFLRPTDAAVIGNEGEDPYPGSAIVGGVPQLGDQSNASYAKIHASDDGSAASNEIVTTTLPAASPSGVTGVVWGVRASVLSVPADLTLYMTAAGLPNSWPITETGVQDYVSEISPAAYPGTDPATIQAYLDASILPNLAVPSPASIAAICATSGVFVTVYETWIELLGATIRARPRDSIRIFA